MSILDVAAADIAQLSDDLLTALLGRLVEAEATEHGIPLNAVIHGGHGNAPDRGIDARVSWSGRPKRTDFFPRRTTVFQCKAETMSAARLKNEMAPEGKPRPLFPNLAEKHGAYVIFCGKDNCNDGMLRDRVTAMRSALSSMSGSGRLVLDFYDSSRIARWVNKHFRRGCMAARYAWPTAARMATVPVMVASRRKRATAIPRRQHAACCLSVR